MLGYGAWRETNASNPMEHHNHHSHFTHEHWTIRFFSIQFIKSYAFLVEIHSVRDSHYWNRYGNWSSGCHTDSDRTKRMVIQISLKFHRPHTMTELYGKRQIKITTQYQTPKFIIIANKSSVRFMPPRQIFILQRLYRITQWHFNSIFGYVLYMVRCVWISATFQTRKIGK